MEVKNEFTAAGFAGQLAQEIVTLVAELRERKAKMEKENAKLETAGGDETWQLERLEREEGELKMVLLDATKRLLALKLELEDKMADSTKRESSRRI